MYTTLLPDYRHIYSMESTLNIWEDYKFKLVEFFKIGYELPNQLQIKAVDEVEQEVTFWKQLLFPDSSPHKDGTKTPSNNKGIVASIKAKVESEDSSHDSPTDSPGIRRSGRKRLNKKWFGCEGDNFDGTQKLTTEEDRLVSEDLLQQLADDSQTEEAMSDGVAPDDIHIEEIPASSLISESLCTISKLEDGDRSQGIAGVKRKRGRPPKENGEVVQVIRLPMNTSLLEPADDFPLVLQDPDSDADLEEQQAIAIKQETDPDTDRSAKKRRRIHIKTEPRDPDAPRRSVGRPRKAYTMADDLIPPINPAEKMHKCGTCKRRYTSDSLLQAHQLVHTGQPLKCITCNKQYQSQAGYESHIRIHDDSVLTVCPECDYKAVSYNQLNRHLMGKHPEVVARPYLCHLCGKSYVLKAHLRCHELTHEGRKDFQCQHCEFITHTKSILDVHIRNKHEDREMLECDICGAKIKYQGSMVEHRRRHFGEKPFPCTTCGARFTSRSQLAQHVRIHGEKNHICPICGKKFVNKHKLARHSTIHTGVKEFECGFCSYRCNVRGNLRKHWLFVHKVDHDRRQSRVTRLDEPLETKTPGRVKPKKERKVSSSSAKTQNISEPTITKYSLIPEVHYETHEQTNSIVVKFSNDDQTDTFASSTKPEIDSQTIQISGASVELVPSNIITTTVDQVPSQDIKSVTVPQTLTSEEDGSQLSVMTNISPEQLYANHPGVQTKVEISEDGTQYVYLIVPEENEQVSTPPVQNEEFVVSIEESVETQEAALNISNILHP